MTEIAIETAQNEIVEESDAHEEENVNETVEEIIVPAPASKKPKKISKKQQRLNAIEDFKNGKSNDDFKVYSLKNGSFRVVKRESSPVEIESNNEPKQEITPVVNHQYTNDQFLINHILELEKKFEKLRLKQKKLKKSHKKLKSDVYDDSEMPVDLNTISHEVDDKNDEISNEMVNEQPKIIERNVETQPVRYNKGKKLSWRQMLAQ